MSYSSTQVDPKNRYSLTIRPITDGEYRLALSTIKPSRYEAVIGSVVGILVAVAVNFVKEEYRLIQLGVPLLFAIAAGSAAIRYRTMLKGIKKDISTGRVLEITATPVKNKFPRFWKMGPLTFSNEGGLPKLLQEGTVSTITLLPNARIVLSLNGVPLKKATPIITIPATFVQVHASPPPLPVAALPASHPTQTTGAPHATGTPGTPPGRSPG